MAIFQVALLVVAGLLASRAVHDEFANLVAKDVDVDVRVGIASQVTEALGRFWGPERNKTVVDLDGGQEASGSSSEQLNPIYASIESFAAEEKHPEYIRLKSPITPMEGKLLYEAFKSEPAAPPSKLHTDQEIIINMNSSSSPQKPRSLLSLASSIVSLEVHHTTGFSATKTDTSPDASVDDNAEPPPDDIDQCETIPGSIAACRQKTPFERTERELQRGGGESCSNHWSFHTSSGQARSCEEKLECQSEIIYPYDLSQPRGTPCDALPRNLGNGRSLQSCTCGFDESRHCTGKYEISRMGQKSAGGCLVKVFCVPGRDGRPCRHRCAGTGLTPSSECGELNSDSVLDKAVCRNNYIDATQPRFGRQCAVSPEERCHVSKDACDPWFHNCWALTIDETANCESFTSQGKNVCESKAVKLGAAMVKHWCVWNYVCIPHDKLWCYK